MNDIKTTNVLLAVNDNAGPPHVTSASDHNNIASIELDIFCDLVLSDVEFDGIVYPDGRV